MDGYEHDAQPGEPRIDPALRDAILAAQTISIDQVTALLDEATLRDQRNAGASDIRAWWMDLNAARATITYAKAMAALSYFYAVEYPSFERDQRRRIEAADIIRLVKKADAELTQNFVFQPEHTDTPTETIARSQQQRTALAQGTIAPAPIGQAQRNPAYVAELVSGVSDSTRIPETDPFERLPTPVKQALGALRHPARAIYCPSCHAAPGAPCTSARGTLDRGRRLHPSRVDNWTVEHAPCPECHAQPGNVCLETTGRPYGRVHAPRLDRALHPETGWEAA